LPEGRTRHWTGPGYTNIGSPLRLRSVHGIGSFVRMVGVRIGHLPNHFDELRGSPSAASAPSGPGDSSVGRAVHQLPRVAVAVRVDAGERGIDREVLVRNTFAARAASAELDADGWVDEICPGSCSPLARRAPELRVAGTTQVPSGTVRSVGPCRVVAQVPTPQWKGPSSHPQGCPGNGRSHHVSPMAPGLGRGPLVACGVSVIRLLLRVARSPAPWSAAV
jgi:hypothetical protein